MNIRDVPAYADYELVKVALFTAGGNRFCEIALLQEKAEPGASPHAWRKSITVLRKGKYGSLNKGRVWQTGSMGYTRERRFTRLVEIRKARRWSLVEDDPVSRLAAVGLEPIQTCKRPQRWRYHGEVCTCDAYDFPHRDGGGDCPGAEEIQREQEEADAECHSCGGSGGGEGYWRCPSCNGSGMSRSYRRSSWRDDPDAYDRYYDR